MLTRQWWGRFAGTPLEPSACPTSAGAVAVAPGAVARADARVWSLAGQSLELPSV